MICSEDRNEKYFIQSKVAEKYDQYIGESIPFYEDIITTIHDFVLKHCTDNPISIIDLGAGTGNLAYHLIMKKLNIHTCFLLDHSESMLKIAESKLISKHIKNFQCINSSFLDNQWVKKIPITNVDIINATFALDHIKSDDDLQNLFHSIYGLLKSGGLFIIGEKCVNPKESSMKSFIKMIDIRKNYMLKHQIKNREDIDKWYTHILNEDFLRPLPVLLKMAEKEGFKFKDGYGISLPKDDKKITSDYFYKLKKLTSLSYEDILGSFNRAFGIGMIVLVKDK